MARYTRSEDMELIGRKEFHTKFLTAPPVTPANKIEGLGEIPKPSMIS